MHCVAHLGIGAVLASLLPPNGLKYCSVCIAMECEACAVINYCIIAAHSSMHSIK